MGLGRMRFKAFVAGIALALGLAGGVAQAQESIINRDDPAFLTGAVGYYDINDDWDAAEFRLEYWSDSKWWIFKPFFGVMATSDEAFNAFAGIRLDLYFGRRFVVTPSFAPTLYHDGNGKDLGHTIEFRSMIDFAYRFDDRSRVGIGIYHLSNASISDNNPGTEVISVHYAMPFDTLFGK